MPKVPRLSFAPFSCIWSFSRGFCLIWNIFFFFWFLDIYGGGREPLKVRVEVLNI